MLSQYSIRLVSICAAILVVAASVFAQGVHTLQGRVTTPNGTQPTAPVKITLTFNGRRIYETFTDLSGRFSFTALARGTYQLTAEGDSQTFETTSVYAEVAAFGSAPQLFTQDIQLRPIAGKPMGQTGVVNAFIQNVPKAARQALERAAKLNRELKTEAAIEQMLDAIRIFPAYFEAHLELGNTFLKAGRFEQAIAELDRAREIDPNDERAYQSFGLVLMKLKNYPVAVAVFAEATRLNPNNPMNALMRATALIHQATTVPEAQIADRQSLLDSAELSLSQASKLSGEKLKADSLTLATFYEMKSEPGRAADELELFLRKSETKNSEVIQKEIKRLRAKAREAKSLNQ
jgi:cytochrome c-type biogenesis protein CcmH/NrfG